jgi:hypothetical protein
MMRALRWTVLCAAILAACICTAQAQSVFTPGTTIERVLHINNKQVPLPEGQWIVAVDTASDWNDQSIGAWTPWSRSTRTCCQRPTAGA